MRSWALKGLGNKNLLKRPRTLSALFTTSNADVPTKMHRENTIALSHPYGKQFKNIQELDKIDSSDSKTSGDSKGAVVNLYVSK